MHTLPLPPLAAAWLPALADAAVKATVVLLAALLVTVALRAASAATRHLVWSAALGALLALPVLSLVVPAIPLPLPARESPAVSAVLAHAAPAAHAGHAHVVVPSGRVAVAAGGHAAGHAVGHAVAVDTVVTPAIAITSPGTRGRPLHVDVVTEPMVAVATTQGGAALAAASRPRASWPGVATLARDAGARLGDAWARLRTTPPPAWLAVAWAAGALLVLLRLVLGTIGIARVARSAVPVEDATWLLHAQRLGAELGIRRPVTLLLSDRRTVPVTWGVLYPVVLLPAEALQWDEERRRAVLLHELAHVERLDALTHVIVQLALALFWFHPLVWLAAARVREERERACDDLVLEHGTRPSRYADDLLTIARTLTLEGGPAFASLAMARPTELEGRLLAILDPARRREGVPGQRLLGGVLAGALLAAPLAAATPDERARFGGDHFGEPAMADVAVSVDTIVFPMPAPPAPPAAPLPPSAPLAPAAPAAPAAPLAPLGDVSVPAAPAAPAAPAPPPAPAAPGAFVAAPRGAPVAPAPPDAPAAPAVPEPPPLAITGDMQKGFRFGADCDLQSRGSTTSMHSTDGADGLRRKFHVATSERCVLLQSLGELELAADDGAVWPASEGGLLEIVERVRGGAERRLELRRVDGGVERRYLVNGRAQPASAADGWLRGILPELVRESAFAVEPRVRRILRQDGVGGVLAEVARIRSDGSKRRHLEVLVDAGRLSPDELRRVALLAGDRIESDGDLRMVLERVTDTGRRDARVAEAVAVAARGIESDGDLRMVLENVAAESPLEGGAVREAFFRALATVESDGDHRMVLERVIAGRELSPATLVAALESARAIESDGDKSSVLVRASRVEALRDADARAAFERALESIRSEGDARRVRRAVQQ